PMAIHGFLRRCTAKLPVQQTFTLCNISREHLHETIRKACFENTTRDGFKGHLKSEVRALPPLLGAIGELPKGFRILGAVPHTAFRSVNLNVPSICFTRCQS